MLEGRYEELASVEDEQWWYVARRSLVRRWLLRLQLPDGARALDIGCGTGGSLEMLGEFASGVVGVDVSPAALRLAREKHPAAELVEADANDLGERFAPGSFDLVTLFNVLYHEWIVDERGVLDQAYRLLAPGGAFIVTEPAHAALRRRLDGLVMGRRRYALRDVQRLLDESGFSRVYGTYFNAVSLLPAWLLSRWDRWRPSAGRESASARETAIPPGVVNAGMKGVMALERAAMSVLGRRPLLCGVTLLCVARKPDASSVEVGVSERAEPTAAVRQGVAAMSVGKVGVAS